MSAGAAKAEEMSQVLRLADSCDPAALELTPAQGFLFSRIDGQTPWRLLREMGGLQPVEVDDCLQRWLDAGFIRADEAEKPRKSNAKRAAKSGSAKAKKARAKKKSAARKSAAARTKQRAKPKAQPVVELPKPQIDETRIDASLDLDEDIQRNILEFEAGLDRNYYQLLGVSRDVDARAIKKAYFRLSRDFHPDRYFRREIGEYAQSLDRIFKKVLEAYELLSDPATRAEIDKTIGEVGQPQPEAAAQSASAESAPQSGEGRPERPRPLTPIERLKQRMPFKINEERIAERKAKADEFHQSAQVAARGAKFLEAASSARLAIAFDPSNAEYKRSFADIQAKAAEARMTEALARDDSTLEAEEQLEAMALYEETLLYKPHDPVINDRAAQLAISLRQIDKALEYAERAVEHSPDEGAYHRTLGQAHHAQGDRGHAVRQLEIALEKNAKDDEARKLLTALKRPSRRKGAR
jgi:curved DNA-binding protein CbpA